jgi:hypothetical protein
MPNKINSQKPPEPGVEKPKARRFSWAREELGFLALCVAVIAVTIILAQVMHAHAPGKGAPLGNMNPTRTPVVSNLKH